MKAGSHTHQLLQLLAVSTEFPAASLHLLGSMRSIKDLVHRLESVQDIRFPSSDAVYQTKLLSVNGYRDKRNIRLSKNALPLLDELYPGALEYYLRVSQNHQFSSGHYHVGRNHRVGEAIAMAMMAGLEFRPYALPQLRKGVIRRVIPANPSFYIARDIKGNECDNTDKTVFTRIVGMVFYPGGCHTVYNTRDAVMKWSGKGEYKAAYHFSELARCNAGLRDVHSALLLGNDPNIALQTIMESDKAQKKPMRFDSIYHRIHFLPLNSNGTRLLQILTLQDWNERILDTLFETEQRQTGVMEYDACINGAFVFSYLDGDLARLIRFRNGLRTETKRQLEVLCYPWQCEFLRSYLGDRVILKTMSMEVLYNAIQ